VEAEEAAAWLRKHGRAHVAVLPGSPLDRPRRMLRAGPEPNRIWEPAWLLGSSRRGCRATVGRSIWRAVRGARRPFWRSAGAGAGVDRLPDALRQARVLARAAGVPPGALSLRRGDLADPGFAARLLRPGRFRVVLCFRYLDRALLPRIAAALAPGGWLIYQTFLEAQARAGRRPSRATYLLRCGELRRLSRPARGSR